MGIWQPCASFRVHRLDNQDSSTNGVPAPSSEIAHTIYLIGDAGGSPEGDVSSAVKLLGKKLETASKNSTVVYLGDNIYPNGLAPKSLATERAEDEHKLRAQLGILKDFPGNVFFVAGNHDWYGHGLEGVKRQQKFIEEYLDRKDVFLPKPGCGDPVEIELEDNLVLVLLDSQWWLENWNGETEINQGCEVKSRKDFQRFFEEAIKGNRNKNIVVALHHPMYTYGPHGGRYTLKHHIFPLTSVNEKLWIPMPIIGSIFPLYRSVLGSKQDVAHPEYQALKSTLIGSARKNGNFIFASGHEHTLQYIEQDDQHFIVSGSGSKKSPTALGEGAAFTYGQNGFSQLDFYKDGSAWVTFWSIDAPEGKIVFQKQIKEPLPIKESERQLSFPEYETDKKTVNTPITTYNFQRGAFWRFLFGDHYRNTYNTTIEAPVLDVAHYEDGLTPTKIGGGYQTNSLRLEDKDEREYAIRSIDKDATRTLPYPFNESFIKTVVKDNFSAAHPMAAMAVARLADSVNIYHTDPKLFYVPKQPGLQEFNDLFGGAMYQLEKRPSGDWSTAKNFGYAEDIKGTLDVVEEMLQDKDVLIDHRAVVRARIFDNLIGDWDRHDDQWRWAELKDGDRKIYSPIPRDRDQAFSKYDGVLVAFLRQFTGISKQFRSYDKEIKKIKWSNYNARNFDPTFLNRLEWAAWEQEARFLQNQLTDEVIERAFREAFPPPVYEQDAEWIMTRLKARRDDLVNIARRLYEFTSRKVDVTGTDGRELFEVERLSDDSTRVRVFDTNKDAEREQLLYERILLTSETKEIRLYGMQGEDIFKISGEANDGILVRAIGGLDEDTFIDESRVHSWGKKTKIYDAKNEQTILNTGSETSKHITNNPELNIYNRRSNDYEYNYGFKLPIIAANPDDGLLVGGVAQYITYGFKKSPYASKHIFSLNYALATSGISFKYNGEYINVLGKWDALLDAQVNTPLYAVNFYGFGNDTPDYEALLDDNDDIDEDDYVRVRQRLVRLEPALLRRVNSAFSWSIGPSFESIRIDSTDGRLIKEFTDQFDPELFDGLEFLGLHFNMNLHNVDNPAFPTKGIGAKLDIGWKHQLDDRDKSFPYIKSSFSIYKRINRKGNLVFATRVGAWHNFNNDFEFYQGATLGGGTTENANFRGFRRERFTGKSAFYNNIDLRWNMLDSENRTLPFSLGLYGGFDHGRVWLDGEDSDTWHYAYGGGLFFSPFDIATLQLGLFRSDDEVWRFALSGGFFF
ncbi:MAG: metallophosphoesterase [Saprospiraceae bacterium]|nr:metallophosphoesterase [Saprospiraceae bacterium]